MRFFASSIALRKYSLSQTKNLFLNISLRKSPRRIDIHTELVDSIIEYNCLLLYKGDVHGVNSFNMIERISLKYLGFSYFP